MHGPRKRYAIARMRWSVSQEAWMPYHGTGMLVVAMGSSVFFAASNSLELFLQLCAMKVWHERLPIFVG